MTKPEWGNKRTCPKCSTRFYDLGNDDPLNCIECGNQWLPEPILKTKQPVIREEVQPVEKESDEKESDDLESDDLGIDDDSDDDDVLVAASLDDEDSEVNEIVDASLAEGEE